MKYRRRLIPRNIQIIGLSIILTTIWAVLICTFYHNVDVVLKDDEVITFDVNKPYMDAGFTIYDNNKEIDIKDIKYSKNSDLDTSKIGEYEYTYEIEYQGKKYYLERKINVVDETPPVIDIETKEVKRDYCTKKNTNYVKYTILDNYDGDITNNAIITEEDSKYIISVSDSSGNSSTTEIPISYNSIPKASIKLNGSKTIYVKLNGEYRELGAKYQNGCKIDKNAEIKINGDVDTTSVGTYKVTYSFNNATATRKVIVYEPKEQKESNASKIIYLTFDDGPSKYTRTLLDILDKYNVKATFFVVGNNVGVIKEEYERGHAIGVHSLTHNWSIYKSLDAYLSDFNKMNDIIEKQTGSRSMIFRFPGGSSNSVSKRYAKGIVKQIAEYMTNAGYVYFDWNVSANDASSNTGEDVYRNVVNGVKNCSKCVILMHDSKQKTVNQVENIIKTFIERGYEFRTLDTNSPTAHHRIKN